MRGISWQTDISSSSYSSRMRIGEEALGDAVCFLLFFFHSSMVYIYNLGVFTIARFVLLPSIDPLLDIQSGWIFVELFTFVYLNLL